MTWQAVLITIVATFMVLYFIEFGLSLRQINPSVSVREL